MSRKCFVVIAEDKEQGVTNVKVFLDKEKAVELMFEDNDFFSMIPTEIVDYEQ